MSKILFEYLKSFSPSMIADHFIQWLLLTVTLGFHMTMEPLNEVIFTQA
jgi:hypothetical protein